MLFKVRFYMLEALFRLQRYKIKCIYARVEAKKMYFYFNFGNYILVDTMYYSPCRGRRWSAECCWFKVVEVVDFYIPLPLERVDSSGSCLYCFQ